MATLNVVNLDALIPREDFDVEVPSQPVTGLDKISIVHLEGPFFGPDLRKPDFQRETNNWSPAKIVDLIRAFVDADLIPAVILWRAGKYIFVIDGAHRLGALLAWIFDDYGDRARSLDYFGGLIPEEQRNIAIRTRKLVNDEVGSYQDYLAARKNPGNAPENMRTRLSNLAVNNIIAQWVPTPDRKSAEDSFFKINQSATPIDPTERRILKARRSASAVAARAITHAGTGHKYWSNFAKEVQLAIEDTGGKIYHALYDPPIASNAITTLDVPVAGRGYNTLPFVFDLVNEANDVDVEDTSAKKEIKEILKDDPDGQETLKFLKSVEKRVQRITGDNSSSLGCHPVVYFYTRSGAFQPVAFLATSRLIEELDQQKKLKEFTQIRKDFEEFLIDHKEAMSLLIHKFGSGGRSLPWLHMYYRRIVEGFWSGKGSETIQSEFIADPDFTFLTVPRPSGVREVSRKTKHNFSANTKTATFFATALPGGTRCRLCGALIHKNSVHFDHIDARRDGGGGDMANAQVAHPYCDSIKQAD
ncbi:MAG: HNH endonuclease [Terracidiphilus sp.]